MSSRRVLVVDDDRDLCWVLSRVLSEGGYSVGVAFDAREARRVAARLEPEALILDLRLPDANGIQLLKALSRGSQQPPAILMTSYPTETVVQQAQASGFAATLTKPFSQADVLAAVGTLFQPRAPSAEPRAADDRNGPFSEGFLLHGILHDLGNPLHSAISTLLYLHSQLEQEGNSHRELSAVVLMALQQMDGLLRGLSALQKDTELPRRAVGLNAVVLDALALLSTECQGKGVRLEYDLDDSLPPILGNTVELARLLLNLTRNGIEAMPRGGVLGLVTAKEQGDLGPSVVLTVSDTGCGLPAEFARQLESPCVSTKGPGRGLGLFLCRQIARAHAARFEIKDRPEGGAMARVEFSEMATEVAL